MVAFDTTALNMDWFRIRFTGEWYDDRTGGPNSVLVGVTTAGTPIATPRQIGGGANRESQRV